MGKRVGRFAAAGLMLLAAACAAPTKIESNKSASYTGEPQRIFVLAEAVDEWGNGFVSGFEKQLVEVLRQCGATVQLSRIGKLDLNDKARAEEMRRFNPDAVLSLRRNGGTKSQYGNVLNVIFDARLLDVKSNSNVWRSSSTVVRGSSAIDVAERGETFAVELTNKLKQDQIFRSCPIIEVKR